MASTIATATMVTRTDKARRSGKFIKLLLSICLRLGQPDQESVSPELEQPLGRLESQQLDRCSNLRALGRTSRGSFICAETGKPPRRKHRGADREGALAMT